MKNSPSRERQAEVMVRLLDSASAISILRGKTLAETFGDEATRRHVLESVSEAEFAELLSGINGLLRGKARGEWVMDGEGVELSSPIMSGHTPPRQEDKPALLGTALHQAQEMSRRGDSLDDCAVLLAASINAIHAFGDGNGRVSRMTYLLLSRGWNAEVRRDLRPLLGEYGRDEIDMDPSRIEAILDRRMVHDAVGENPENITHILPEGRIRDTPFSAEIPDESRLACIDVLYKATDDYLAFLSVYRQFRRMDDQEQYLRRYPAGKFLDKQLLDRAVIMLERFTPDLDLDAVHRIITEFWQLKKESVERLIDAIAHPEKPEYVEYLADDIDGTALDSFRQRTEELKSQREEESQ